ncbi:MULTISPECIES: hypothetical protein [Actinosynnema]|uniref:hypothetical protein n=1 Tax=Actinosynnema TaxID=40566 RepID=UPI0020A59C00|nr:hypothetical protein [Actinosynnema pretiosum]MCP2096706.1 Right handed beta helix region [Actinosynnema pretiosum]
MGIGATARLAAAVAAALLVGSGSAGAAQDELVVRVRQGGAVPTLEAARALIAAEKPAKATVLVHGGTYSESVLWRGTPAGSSITIAPQPNTGDVVFDGRAADGYWVQVAPKSGTLTFRGPMTVRRYGDAGVRAVGTAEDGPVRGLTVRGLVFAQIGNAWVPGGGGYAGVHLNHATGARITGNSFRNLENSDCPGCVHGVYLAFNLGDRTAGSDRNTVDGNTFQAISGDPVRASDGSGANVVRDNVFRSGTAHDGAQRGTGRYGIFSYWSFERADVCARAVNTFSGNRYGNGYYGDPIPAALTGSATGRECDSVRESGTNAHRP